MEKGRDSSIGDAVVGLSLLAVLLVFVVVLSPIWIPIALFAWIREKIRLRRFRQYLGENEGAKFFCYASRKRSEAFVETNIVPFLGSDVRILHIQDKSWLNLGDDSDFAESIIWSMRATEGGFPYIAKVVNGELVSQSINQRLYRTITRNANAEPIVTQIGKFFR